MTNQITNQNQFLTEDQVNKLYSQLDEHLSEDKNQIRTVKSGDIIEGVIVEKNPGYMIVDIGYKSEGIVADKEMESEIIETEKLASGDTVMVYVVKIDSDGGVVLSIKRADQSLKWMELDRAMKNNEKVEAEVVEFNNGGLICNLGGGIRGFIPTSQLDATRVYEDGVRRVGRDISEVVQKKLSKLVGETIGTRISELNREKNKIILSEKMLLQEYDINKKEETLREISEGDVMEGKVSGITPYGVFVNAQGLEGLVHLSELSWDKVERVEDLYHVGDEVNVQVIGIADNGKRVAYSIKRLKDDPWKQAISKFKVGDIVEGEVQRVVDYGAFVRIGKGLNGLIHISEMSDKLVRDPHDYVNEGDTVNVKILSISSTERHLGLSLKEAQRDGGYESRISVDKPVTEEPVDQEKLAEEVESALEDEIEGKEK